MLALRRREQQKQLATDCQGHLARLEASGSEFRSRAWGFGFKVEAGGLEFRACSTVAAREILFYG